VLDPKAWRCAVRHRFTCTARFNWRRSALGVRVIARHLKPGGRFISSSSIRSSPCWTRTPRDHAGYFNSGEALASTDCSYAGGDHADRSLNVVPREIVQSLLDAGLTLTSLREFPYCVHNCWKFLEESEPGRFVVKHHPGKLPLLFSLGARK
jgi:hypothetical protein